MSKKLSIIIPVFNSAEGLQNFVENLISTVSKQFQDFEIIMVDDCSRDSSWSIIEKLSTIHKNIKGKVTKNTNKIGYVPQKISIDWTLPIRVIDFMSLTQTLQFDEVVSALKLTEVEHLKHNDLRSLSGGEFQRVLMARAIAKKPDLLVLDEPVQGVDFTGEIALYELIKKISDELNCGILLISHDLNVVMSKTDYVVCLNGHVCCSGTPTNVANNKNYKELFGDQASTLLSVYEHKHDHTHSTDGSIKEKKH